jgi:signal recognition particle subunit SRP72
MAAAGSQSLSVLLHRSTLDDHEEVLNACNALLRKGKTDIATQQVKAVALLKLDRYDDAARFFEEAGDGLKGKAKLEYAYTLYKTGKLQEAAELASQIGDRRAARHVEAQSVGAPRGRRYHQLTDQAYE